MEEMPLEAEREGGNAHSLPASWVTASYCPQNSGKPAPWILQGEAGKAEE